MGFTIAYVKKNKEKNRNEDGKKAKALSCEAIAC
jgi:hypothetical protein